MRTSLAVLASTALFGVLGALSPAQAQTSLPPDRSVFYNIHADTQDPESPVLIATEIRLRARFRTGNDVGWYPSWIAITQYDGEGEIEGSWHEALPSMTTGDGLWHVTHENPLAPKTAEFVKPPEISGIAYSDEPNGPALDYYILGNDTGGSTTPYPITSMLDYSFLRSDEPEPVEDDDEPADTPEGDDEPL